MLNSEQIFTWSDWYPLEGCWRGSTIPALPGLYRIRRGDCTDLDYLGQTGIGKMTLRKRVAMLKGIFDAEMPYRAPHTAAPALWALRHKYGCTFEVSILPVKGSTPWRKGLEALAVSLYRYQVGRSPTVNFGRMPGGYQISSSNDAKLVAAGKRIRGGLTDQQDANHLPGIAPAGSLTDAVLDSNWCGHEWSDWMPVAHVLKSLSPESIGLYRIRGAGQPKLIYVGQGVIRSRLGSHLNKAITPLTRQGVIFANAQSLEASYVCNLSWYKNQREELENDLIASHLLVTETIPDAQFLGK